MMLETRTKLELFLQPYIDQNEGTFDYHALHGFLTGLTICPVDLSEEERNENIFDGEIALTSEDAATLNQLIAKVQTSIDRSFHDEEEGFSLSCEGELDDLDDDELVNWCTGFMAAHFWDQDTWFNSHNVQEVCELLLPIMLGSHIFDDEQEFIEIRKDTQLVEDMLGQIAEVVMELYLMFNAPEDKKAKH